MRGTLGRAIAEPVRVAVPLALVLVMLLEGLFLVGALSFALPTRALASQCTLTSLTGGVELQKPGLSTWEEAEDGVTLEAGSLVRTGPDSDALLTFFNGTTVKLDPGTVLEVKQAEGSQENQPTNIVLKQSLGRTWSRVTKLVDPRSHYEIETPSAIALVRGTLFVTEVDETGATRVQTIEGLVSVIAQGEEVYLPAGKQTMVAPGTPPSEPAPIDPAQSEPAGNAQMRDTQPAEKTVVAGPLVDGEPPVDGEGNTAAAGSAGSEETSAHSQGELDWKDQYKEWLIAVIVGLMLFSFGLTAIMLRRQ